MKTGTPLYFYANGYGLKARSPLVYYLCFAWVLRRVYVDMRTHIKGI